jgi:phytoene synthase
VTTTDDKACATLLRGGSRSFYAASRLLPAHVRQAATALYAFCRVADDAIDAVPSAAAPAALAKLQTRLAHIYNGAPSNHAEDRAFAAIVHRHAIPQALPAALLEGFAWDATGRRYENFPALLEYAARVAGSVGAMMALVMGVRAPDVVARACELGLAMQLTNIARDVGEDARLGRLYLPLDWLAEAGVDPAEFLRAPAYCQGVGAVVRRLLNEADILYAQASAGIAQLPASCRPAIHAARLLYAAIGHHAGGAAFDPVARRAVVPGRAKLGLVLQAVAASALPARATRPVEVPAAWALVAAAELPAAPMVAVREYESRFAWMVQMLAALDDREQAAAAQ